MEKFFPKERIVITGNPIRQAIADLRISREEGIRFFKLDPSRKTVFVTGGSLGGKNINEAIAASIEEFSTNDLQLIWQAGRSFADTAKQVSEGRRNVWTSDFIAQMEYAFAAADIVVSRSGAMAVSELCVVKKPVIFVPFPFAAEDHQTVNARRLVDKGAALMVTDEEVRSRLMPMIVELSNDESRRQQLTQNISRLAVRNADETIAREIINNLNA